MKVLRWHTYFINFIDFSFKTLIQSNSLDSFYLIITNVTLQICWFGKSTSLLIKFKFRFRNKTHRFFSLNTVNVVSLNPFVVEWSGRLKLHKFYISHPHSAKCCFGFFACSHCSFYVICVFKFREEWKNNNNKDAYLSIPPHSLGSCKRNLNFVICMHINFFNFIPSSRSQATVDLLYQMPCELIYLNLRYSPCVIVE